MRTIQFLAVTAAIVAFAVPPATADARVEQATTFDMPGAIGAMAKMFSRGSDEGIVSLVLVRGDRKLERHGDSGTLIDLAERKVVEIDFRRRRYTVRTFDEIRREMEQALERAGRRAGDEPGAGDRDEDGTPNYEVTFDVRRTGETRTIGGHECREMLMTITARPREGAESDGGTVRITSSMWIGPKLPALDEVAAFDRRYAEALGLGTALDEGGTRLASLQAMYPALTEGLKRLREHADDFDGSVLLTETTISVEGSAGEPADAGAEDEGDDTDRPKMGRVLKKLGGIFGRKRREREARQEEERAAAGEPAAAGGMRTLFTTRTEVRSVGSDVAPGELAIPEGFRER